MALAVHHLVTPLREAMATQGLLSLHDELEVPLVRVLAKMEYRGIGVDPTCCRRFGMNSSPRRRPSGPP